MHKTTRYLFILLCFVLFIVLAPLIILYVSGTKLSLSDQEYTATGILVAKTDPNDADVYINDEKKDTTPATVRFLDQGEYVVTLKKEGYFDWTKRLPVETGKVTYAYEGVEAVELIRQPIPVSVPVQQVTSLLVINERAWLGAANALHTTTISNPMAVEQYTLPFTPQTITAIRDSDYLLISGDNNRNLIFNTNSRVAFSLPTQLDTATDVTASPDGTIFARANDTVYSYNLTSKVLTPVLRNAIGFTMLGNTGYIAVTQENNTTLQTAQWVNNRFTTPEPLLANQLPAADTIQLIITRNKELFAYTNTTLYRINAELEVVGNQVTSVTLDERTHELTFTTQSELWFYNFLVNRPQLLTRSTSKVNAFTLRSSIGYGFIATDTGLEMLEIDTRDHQNRYQLVAQSVQTLGISDNRDYIFTLQNGQVQLIRIR